MSIKARIHAFLSEQNCFLPYVVWGVEHKNRVKGAFNFISFQVSGGMKDLKPNRLTQTSFSAVYILRCLIPYRCGCLPTKIIHPKRRIYYQPHTLRSFLNSSMEGRSTFHSPDRNLLVISRRRLSISSVTMNFRMAGPFFLSPENRITSLSSLSDNSTLIFILYLYQNQNIISRRNFKFLTFSIPGCLPLVGCYCPDR